MNLRNILHAESIDSYQKVLLMCLLDAQDHQRDWVSFEDLAKTMNVTAKCMREKALPLIEMRWIVRGKRGFYALNKIPQMF